MTAIGGYMEHPNTNPGQPESGGNGHSTPEEVEEIRAQLSAEQDARSAAETVRDEAAATIGERDARIAALEAQLNDTNQTLEAASADIEVRNDAYQDAVTRLAEARCIASIITSSSIKLSLQGVHVG